MPHLVAQILMKTLEIVAGLMNVARLVNLARLGNTESQLIVENLVISDSLVTVWSQVVVKLVMMESLVQDLCGNEICQTGLPREDWL